MTRYGKKASDAVGEAMHELKEGTLRSGRSGAPVRSRKQAIAIGLSEARREGGKVPARSKTASGTRRRAAKSGGRGASASRGTSRSRSSAASRASGGSRSGVRSRATTGGSRTAGGGSRTTASRSTRSRGKTRAKGGAARKSAGGRR